MDDAVDCVAPFSTIRLARLAAEQACASAGGSTITQCTKLKTGNPAPRPAPKTSGHGRRGHGVRMETRIEWGHFWRHLSVVNAFFAPAVVASEWAFILDRRTSSLLSLFDWESLVRNRFFSSEIDSTAPFEVLANPPPFPHTHTPLRSHSGVDEVVKRVHLNKIEKSRIPSNPLGTHRLHLAPPTKSRVQNKLWQNPLNIHTHEQDGFSTQDLC